MHTEKGSTNTAIMVVMGKRCYKKGKVPKTVMHRRIHEKQQASL